LDNEEDVGSTGKEWTNKDGVWSVSEAFNCIGCTEQQPSMDKDN
jgi:hypothetical protein